MWQVGYSGWVVTSPQQEERRWSRLHSRRREGELNRQVVIGVAGRLQWVGGEYGRID